jgi:hypothetical protein
MFYRDRTVKLNQVFNICCANVWRVFRIGLVAAGLGIIVGIQIAPLT